MPNYDYYCEDCGKQFSVNLSFSEYEKFSGGTKCPNCKGKNVRRVYHTIPVHFMGKGFTKSVRNGENEHE